jgi:uncharacterized membrane protein YeaQ/YmgE (transglycosylase-associated protein family)
MAIGAIAQLILGRKGPRVDWRMAIIAGFVGSFVGGMIFSLLAGDGIQLRLSGVIGSVLGATIVTALWYTVIDKKIAEQKAAKKNERKSTRG